MSKGEIVDRFPAVAVGFEIDAGDEDNGKHPQVIVEMRGVAHGDDDHRAGFQFWKYMSLHPNAQEITAETLRRLGWRCNDITKLEGLGSTTVQIVEKNDTYKGKPKKVYDIWDLRGPRATLREEDQAGFANKFKALAAAFKPVEVGEHNAAPAVLPEVVARNAASTPANGAGKPSDLYDA